jgi:hypothetical protein
VQDLLWQVPTLTNALNFEPLGHKIEVVDRMATVDVALHELMVVNKRRMHPLVDGLARGAFALPPVTSY